MSLVATMIRHPIWFSCFVICFLLAGLGLHYRTLVGDYLGYQYWRLFKDENFQSGTVQNGDVSIYFESHGKGTPLLLLHGGLTSMDIFFAHLPRLATDHRVIAIDFRGQGRSTFGNNPFTYRLLASDVIAVMDVLNVSRADLVGWSDGGNAGLVLAIDQPARIDRMVLIGANFNPSGLTDSALSDIADLEASEASVMSRLFYLLRSPHPRRWDELRRRVFNMWESSPDLSLAAISQIKAQTLIMVGEQDLIKLDHTKSMAAAIPESTLVIINNSSHNLLFESPNESLAAILSFFETSESSLDSGEYSEQ